MAAHDVGNLDEAADVRARNQARESSWGSAVLLAGVVACVEAVGHDVLQFVINLLARPRQPLRVLGHLKSRHRDTTAVGGLYITKCGLER